MSPAQNAGGASRPYSHQRKTGQIGNDYLGKRPPGHYGAIKVAAGPGAGSLRRGIA